MKKLKIAQVAPLWFPIPPKKYGGTEKIVFYLCEELKKLGHDITLVFYRKFKSFSKNSLVEKKRFGRR
jgi:hypothetical protein